VAHIFVFGASTVIVLTLTMQELSVLRRPAMRMHRQTSQRWRSRTHPWRAAFLWGVDLGMGATTQRPYASFWALLFAVLAISLQPYQTVVVMMLFGVGRAATVWTGPLLARRRSSTAVREALPGEVNRWRPVHAVLMIALAALIVSVPLPL
jgi:hypothetical protein